MKRYVIFVAALVTLALAGLVTASLVKSQPPHEIYRSTESALLFLDKVERDTFNFFWDTTPPNTGLAPDRTPSSDVSSIAAIGFALTAYLTGIERGYVRRDEAAARILTTLTTLWQLPQGPAANGVAGNHGLFYHFLDGHTGLRANQSEVSTIDTALLMAGVLACRQYFDRDDAADQAIRDLADRLYRRVDWTWAYSRRRRPLLSMGWTPESGFLDADWNGYNEAMILYILAMGSPTHAISPSAWDDWTRTYRWASRHGRAHVTFGPLFGHQYSHVWIDFRGIQDRFMRSKNSDYFANSVEATYANRAYCIANPDGWKGYGGLLWGLTASDGPLGPFARAADIGTGQALPQRLPQQAGAAAASALTTAALAKSAATPFHAYWARGSGPNGPADDDGTIAPAAAGGSVPFAPEIAIPTLMNFVNLFGDRVYGKYGFKDAFNLSFPAKGGWFDYQYVAIDQGPILLMIENYRTGFVWDLMRENPYIVAGLKNAGFSGGWLAPKNAN